MGYIDIRITSNTDIINNAIIDVASVGIRDVFITSGVDASKLGDLRENIKSNNIQGIKANVSAALADEILKRAKIYCPVDTGRLVNSGRIERKSDGTCDVIFGNEECEYAWYVHENMSARHERPTSAKFLTRAVQEVEAIWGAI